MMSTLSSVAMTTPMATSTTTRRPPARAVVVRASASSIARLNRRPLNHRGSHRSSTRSRVGLVVRAASSDSGPPGQKKEEKYSNLTKMRSEAQAPFRTFRLFIFGAFAANATLGLSIATLQAVTKALCFDVETTVRDICGRVDRLANLQHEFQTKVRHPITRVFRTPQQGDTGVDKALH